MLDLLTELQRDLNAYLRMYIDTKDLYHRRSPESRRAKEFMKLRKVLKEVIGDYQPPREVIETQEETAVAQEKIHASIPTQENPIPEEITPQKMETTMSDSSGSMEEIDRSENRTEWVEEKSSALVEKDVKTQEEPIPTSTATFIVHSVGQKGKNQTNDILVVQDLIKKSGQNITVDGICGNGTIKAIVHLQKRLGFKTPDGRIDPDGGTFKGLLELIQEKKNAKITDTVGYKGANKRKDARLVQELLNQSGAKLVVDGLCGKGTINAIKKYQKETLSIEHPTGLIEFEDITWHGLKGNLSL